MRGPEAAAGLVKSLLEDRLPAKLAELNARLELEGEELLEPPQVIATEPRPQLDEFPFAEIIPQEAGRLARLDVPAAGEVYAVTYRLRVYLWSRDQEFPTVTLRRNRMALGLREVLLEHLALSDQLGGAVTNPSSLRESYSEPGQDEVGRSIAASYTEIEVTIEEQVTRPDLGGVNDVIVAGANTARGSDLRHPALD